MYKNSSGYIYSASDLIIHMNSPFASWMSRLALDKPERLNGIEKDHDEMMGLLAEKGIEHEEQFLEDLREEYGTENVAEIKADKRTAADATHEAMKAGYKVIFQAYLERDNFAGFADFLVRREGKSDLGDYYYEAWDTKLSKSMRPYFVVQLCCYSWMLERIQGKIPEESVVVFGDKTKDRFRITAHYYYFQSLKQQFLEAQANFTGDVDTMPDPTMESDLGAWASYANQLMEQSDSLGLVATIRKNQIKRLREQGIETLTQLATTELDHVKGISLDTFIRIKAQADIQLQSRGQEKPCFSVINEDKGKGLSALPLASELDVFFDIEGHPLVEGGLEYLWGVSYQDTKAAQGNAYAFKDWWANNQQQEKKAFENFIDWVYQRWQEDPTMHVYHYASYEITAMRKLSSREQIRLKEVAEMLKNGVFIDLYKIVKNGLLIGERKYSIKNVEHLYRSQRTTDVANGGESIVFYDNWLAEGGSEKWVQQDNGYTSWLADPDNFDWTEWATLKDIRDYNIDDCESTLELFEWLGKQQKASGISYSPIEDNDPEKEKTDRQVSNQIKKDALIARQQALIDRFEKNEKLNTDPRAELLVSLLHFHDREQKPKNWSYYERLEKTDEELFDDDTVLSDITLSETNYDEGNILCTATYDNSQSVRSDKFSSATIQNSEVKAANIIFSPINDHQSEVSFNIKANDEESLQQTRLTLFGDDLNINTDTLKNRLCEITEQYFDTGKLAGVIDTILNQSNPIFSTSESPLPISRQRYPDDDEYMQAMIATIEKMHNTCLCIQGPPGAGKTYTAIKVINALVKAGKRIGIMSNNHAAIMNLLKSLPEVMPDANLVKVGGYGPIKDFKELYPEDDYPNLDYRTSMKFTKNAPYEQYDVIGATVYGFAKDVAYEAPLDYLFVDEASQVALAYLIEVSGAADNIILIGDQMQLEQPIQGSHPGEAGKSALEFMLKGHSVIPDDQGVFLERTYRMHPDVCQPLSEVVYEGKLKADDDNVHQAITIGSPHHVTKQNGILSIPVQHEGNTQCSEEEVLMVQKLVDELKTGIFTDKTGQTKPVSNDDILIVAPYNMQVNLLKEKLSGDFKIGTIDKFQGQEAPIVIISMAVSDAGESSRGLDFVFDINRLNVAVSRAQALAIIVSNEGLEQCRINSLRQMEKVGFFYHLNNAN